MPANRVVRPARRRHQPGHISFWEAHAVFHGWDGAGLLTAADLLALWREHREWLLPLWRERHPDELPFAERYAEALAAADPATPLDVLDVDDGATGQMYEEARRTGGPVPPHFDWPLCREVSGETGIVARPRSLADVRGMRLRERS
jgi:hypothetical protein